MSKIAHHLTIVGVGLLGSSLGLAVKKRRLADTVLGVDRCQKTLDVAHRRGAVDAVATEIDALADIDDGLAIICTPVRSIVGEVERITAINKKLLISDVGSTKANICRELEQRRYRFIGAHPIAGSEKSGPEFGNADLFQNRLTVLITLLTRQQTQIKTNVLTRGRNLLVNLRTQIPKLMNCSLPLQQRLTERLTINHVRNS
jgi:prephenate dehydrogenase